MFSTLWACLIFYSNQLVSCQNLFEILQNGTLVIIALFFDSPVQDYTKFMHKYVESTEHNRSLTLIVNRWMCVLAPLD